MPPVTLCCGLSAWLLRSFKYARLLEALAVLCFVVAASLNVVLLVKLEVAGGG